MNDNPVLLRARHEGVLVATLNRPEKGNALNQQLIDELDRLAAEVEQELSAPGGPRALVLTGAGPKAFSSGADVSELRDLDAPAANQQMRRGQQVFGRIESLPAVVIAAIKGFALGGGLELAMAADIRIADPGARLGQPEITLANLPGWGGTQRLPRLIGRGRATELILTGEVISAQRAYELGLVNRLADDPLSAAVELAGMIAARSLTAVSGAKQAIRIGLAEGPQAGQIAEAAAVAACCETAEQRAAVAAFLRRKAP